MSHTVQNLDPMGRLLAFAQSAAGTLRVRSALNPMLWLSVIALPICLGFSLLFKDNPAIVGLLIVIGALPIVATIIGFFFFMVKAPSKLQSEEYQIKQQALELIQSKGSPIEVLPITLEGISNPNRIQITHENGQ